MKTDEFDEAFRRKVESFHPPFSKDEIDRVHGYVNQYIPLSLWQRFKHIFNYSVGTLVILTLITTTIFQANENKSLLNKISELNNQLKEPRTQTVVNGTSLPVIIKKIDTVYVVQHIKHKITIHDYEQDIATQARLNKIEEASAENNIEVSENMVIASKNKNGKSISNLNKIGIVKQNFPQSNNENKINVTNKGTITNKQTESTIQQNGFLNMKSDYQNASEDHADKNKNNTNQITNNQPIHDFQNSLNQPILEEVSSNKIVLKDLKSRGYQPFGLSPAISFAERQLKTKNWVNLSTKKSGFSMPQISLPTLKYRIGLGSNIDNSQFGTSILTEVLFSKRWSITTGINVSFLGFEHFGDEDDFKKRTEQDFRKQHDLDLPLSSPIKDIDAHQVLFRIPLYLNYRLALRKDFTVLFSTGTDLDVNLQQITSFSHHDYVKENRQEDLNERMKVTHYNNWMISTGIEKRWKRFSVQLSPYFSYQLKPLHYRNNEWMFGVKLNGFYRISR